jgi:hypothetical protein
MATPRTEAALRRFLESHGHPVSADTDIAATASHVLANWAAATAARRPRVVTNPRDRQNLADQLAALQTAERALRSNPLQAYSPLIRAYR